MEQDEKKKLSDRQAGYVAIELAWRHFFPWLELPCKLHQATWLNSTSGNLNLVLDTIEKVALEDVLDPERAVWQRLRKFDPRHSAAFAARRATA